MSTNAPGDWLTIGQLAARLSVSTRTVERRVAEEAWPSTLIPETRARRFSPADVALIEAALACEVAA